MLGLRNSLPHLIFVFGILTLTLALIQPGAGSPSHVEGEWDEDHKKAKLTTSMTFINESIERHNYYRSKHGVCPLVFNQNLSEVAQSWANLLASRSRNCQAEECLQHSLNKFIGENLALKGRADANHSSNIDGSFAVDAWYNQTKDYVFKTGKSRSGAIGELTQMLWKGTSDIGVASAEYEKDGWRWVIVVANYYPPGNFLTQSIDNVFPEGLRQQIVPGIPVPAPGQ